MIKPILVAFVISVTCLPIKAWSCSVFYSESNSNEKYVAKNYDWHFPHGFLIVNKTNVEKVALILDQVPAKWTSKYGSVTFNQYGSDFPQGGINSEGLVVEVLWLDSAVYPDRDERPTLNELQWIQYQLDNFSKTEEMVRHLDQIRVAEAKANVHYFVCDASGDCAVIEPLRGKMVVSNRTIQTENMITNSTYLDSIQYARNPSAAESTPSLKRYDHLSKVLNNGSLNVSIEKIFDILTGVQEKDTQWSIVYDIKNRTIFWKSQESPSVKSVSLRDLDFSCRQRSLFLDVNSIESKSVQSLFAPLSRELNEKLILKSLENEAIPFPTEKVRKQAISALSGYSEHLTKCRDF
jgi:choloylglycine hydrolase